MKQIDCLSVETDPPEVATVYANRAGYPVPMRQSIRRVIDHALFAIEVPLLRSVGAVAYFSRVTGVFSLGWSSFARIGGSPSVDEDCRGGPV